jgi:transposase
MRGDDQQQGAMFSYISPEQRVPADHPLRPIRQMVDDVLLGLSPQFDAVYARTGRPSIAPEKLLRALLLPLLYSVRSERQLIEQLNYNLLFRWFVGLNMDDPVWDATGFTKNRDRLLAGDVAQKFFDQVLAQAYARDLVSLEHFSVDGTLLEAWASQKSFQPKPSSGAPPDDPPPGAGRNPNVDFRGQTRTNDTHESTPEPEARLYKKAPGQPAELSYLGHVLMEALHTA